MLFRFPSLPVATVLGLLATGTLSAGDELDAVVAKLASENYKERQEASAELQRRGRETPELVRGRCLRAYLETHDPEIRLRSKEILRELMADTYGFLGVQPKAREYFDEEGETRTGVGVLMVLEGHAAQTGGVQVGDIVISLDGKAFDEKEAALDFSRRIRLMGAGRKVLLKLQRGGEVIELSLTTGSAPKELLGAATEERFQEWLKAQEEGAGKARP